MNIEQENVKNREREQKMVPFIFNIYSLIEDRVLHMILYLSVAFQVQEVSCMVSSLAFIIFSCLTCLTLRVCQVRLTAPQSHGARDVNLLAMEPGIAAAPEIRRMELVLRQSFKVQTIMQNLNQSSSPIYVLMLQTTLPVSRVIMMLLCVVVDVTCCRLTSLALQDAMSADAPVLYVATGLFLMEPMAMAVSSASGCTGATLHSVLHAATLAWLSCACMERSTWKTENVTCPGLLVWHLTPSDAACMIAYLRTSGKFNSVELEYRETGHTHNEQEQHFSVAAIKIASDPVLEDPEEFRDHMQATSPPSYGRKLVVEILPQVYDFKEWLYKPLNVHIQGLTSTSDEPNAAQVWPLILRSLLSKASIADDLEMEGGPEEWKDLSHDPDDTILLLKDTMHKNVFGTEHTCMSLVSMQLE